MIIPKPKISVQALIATGNTLIQRTVIHLKEIFR